MKKIFVVLCVLSVGLYANLVTYGISESKKGNYRKAITALKKACDEGDDEGCKFLGVLYVAGNIKIQDKDKARYFFNKACDMGNSDSCFNLAEIYRHGDGIHKDLNRATSLYAKSCNGNVAVACMKLGVMYAIGITQDINGVNAAKYFEKACNGGNAKGCIYLDTYYPTRNKKSRMHNKFRGKVLQTNEMLPVEPDIKPSEAYKNQ